MRYSEGNLGRVFVIRLEQGDILHKEIENFAKEKQIKSAALIIVGGVDRGSKIVVGPEDDNARPVTPMEFILQNAHEATGTGTLFPDENGEPMLHMHIACGREDNTITGCIRRGVVTWNLLEIVLIEITGVNSYRKFEKELGFHTLQP
jgi:predicted DNA-binding protein with PD1-like motif